ncbi:MAG: energy-coupling factor transporter ATPase [Eggerthellaceae bacterium]|jgi:energy-coupling factor transporter ATPase
MSLIDFDDVAYTYDGSSYVLRDIDLRIERGSFTCILGGNGSGKSTLAKHINALLTPDRGTVRVLGWPTDDAKNRFFIRSKAGMVFQNPDDQLVASLIENDVAFGPENLGVENPELRQRVTDALREVGLQGFEKKETAALSGGQKQRVAIAGVLAMDPDIIILDEASAMLDPRGRHGLMKVCRALHNRGMTVVMITHFMEEAAEADRVIVLDGGSIVADGTPDEILTDENRLRSQALDVPPAVQLSDLLRQRGVPVGISVGEDELVGDVELLLGAHGRKQARTAGSTAEGVAAPAQTGERSGMPAGTFGHANAPAGGSSEAGFPADESVPGEAGFPAGAGESPETGAAATDGAASKGASSDGKNHALVFDHVSYSYDAHAARSESKRRRSRKHDASPATTEAAAWGSDPNATWALHDVSFTLEDGAFLGIAGHTGSGKSTLVQHMNGLLHPLSGRVLVDGTDIASKKAAAYARAHVGLVFQYPERQLFAATVADDVAFGPRNLGLSDAEVDERVRRALMMVGLDYDDEAAASPFALSGGQQRRVAIAGVLAMEPKTLILDEPAAGLDPESRENLLDLVRRLHDEQGLTIVMVSHNMDDLARLCSQVLVMDQGRVAAFGTPAQVFADEAGLKAIGLGVPFAVHVANRLRACGCDLGAAPTGGLYDRESLADAIAARWRATQTDRARAQDAELGDAVGTDTEATR